MPTLHGYNLRRRENESRLISGDGEDEIKLGMLSPIFILRLFDAGMINKHPNFRPSVIRGREEKLPITECIRILTIKIKTGRRRTIKYMNDLAQAALFNYSYVKEYSITLVDSMKESRPYKNRAHHNLPNYPLQNYNYDLVKYYNLGLDAQLPIFSYLAFYNILEHFFPSVIEDEIHQKIKDNILQPDFSINNKRKLKKITC